MEARRRPIDVWKLAQLRSGMKAHSYGLGGQDPRKLLKMYDRDNSGELDLQVCLSHPPTHPLTHSLCLSHTASV